ncbi:reticulocyte-binding protein 2 a-like protein [Diplodia corticola]|uniref:Reticulocyte-binding protein 2 a-like protein n=1 Tax=Diplodia corticola TaxID=236234 RepID=A0A1J9REX4_9PEZI|nr:reticulocyte-binding protein 2 a-like protein [Diplodia corticola]OJD38634.1 reticulocyte-binding protein 2 a-like protein [Diplodia corticola]
MQRGWDDEFYYSDERYGGTRYPAPGGMGRSPFRRSGGLLDPGAHHHVGGLHRSHSTGSRGVPNIHIHNNIEQDMHPRLDARAQQRTPSASPRGRPVMLDDEWALEDDAPFRLAPGAARSRSRGRPGFAEHFHHHDHFGSHHDSPSPDYRAVQLALTEERRREAEERLRREQAEEFVRKDMELKYIREQQEREEEEALIQKRLKLKMLKDKADREEEAARLKREEEHIRQKYELKREQDERKRRAEEEEIAQLKKRAVQEEKERAAKEAAAKKAAAEEYRLKMEKEAKEAEDERKRIIADFERKKSEDAKKKQEEEQALIRRLKEQEEAKKKREKAEWEEFERKQKEKQEKAAAEKKKKEEEFEADMRKRLAQFGFQENQIQAMIKPEKAKDLAVGLSPANPIEQHHHHHHQHKPTYVKVHRDHLAIETLTYYNLPWEWDRTDTDYIIILREMDARETDILFEHTKRVRSKTTETRLLIQERHNHDGKPEYAWVRKRSKSKSPMRVRAASSPKRNVLWLG